MKDKKDVLHYLKEEADNLAIPDSITPEQMKKRLEQIENIRQEQAEGKNSQVDGKNSKKERVAKSFPYKHLVAAACICLFIGTVVVFTIGKNQTVKTKIEPENYAEVKKEAVEETIEEGLVVTIEYPETTYEEIYESMFGDWEEMQHKYNYRGEFVEGALIQESFASDGAIPEAPASDSNLNDMYKEYAAAEVSTEGILSDSAMAEKTEECFVEHGTTNVQTQGVEEADVVKNDGRYLYQKIYQENNNVITQAIQIVDTVDGLKEVKRIEGFENIQEFYVWEDILVIIENKYLEIAQADTQAEKLRMMEDPYYGTYNHQYHEISFYNIKERSMPVKIKTFTLKGTYDSSRISDGYFYGFSKYYAAPGKGESDYEAYIPLVDGAQLKTEQILLPEENEGNCYLLLTSIDLSNPTKFADTTAIVTDSDMYYVSKQNIYIADSLDFEKMQGKQTNRISLLRFAYEKGKFYFQAEGEVPGNLESSFSMDEYDGNLRLVTTVNEYWFEEIKDELTGQVIGNDMIDEKQSNALYVLDSDLKIIGKNENLAEDERIYSARFFGEVGYFVTFRQMDPLFAVDLKDPKNPKILSELKISGFSEYLHFYGKDRLLGIGMEAEVETGRTNGMKLSMFDISNPADVQEISKLHLSSYDYSEALYNHRAVMISTGANIFGFEIEGYNKGDYKRDYVVYTYENDQFVEVLKIEMKNQYGEIYSSRGTFIGNMFYLLTRDGSVKSYNLDTGKLCESLTLKESD